MLGLTLDKLLIIMVIALVILGPDKLPYYAQKLGELVKGMKRMADGAKERVKDEMGPEFDDMDWKQLDPRQYDPRKIIREALQDEAQTPEARRARAAAASRARRANATGAPMPPPDAAAGASPMGVVAGSAAAAVALAAQGDAAEDGSPDHEVSPPEAPPRFNFDEEAT